MPCTLWSKSPPPPPPCPPPPSLLLPPPPPPPPSLPQHLQKTFPDKLESTVPPCIPMLKHFTFLAGSLSRSSAALRSFSTNSSVSSSAASASVDWSKFYESTSTPAALALVQKKRRRFLPTLGGDTALVSPPFAAIQSAHAPASCCCLPTSSRPPPSDIQRQSSEGLFNQIEIIRLLIIFRPRRRLCCCS